MKQVWQAEDGTIFTKEEDCEYYEYKIEKHLAIVTILNELNYAEDTKKVFLKVLEELVTYGYKGILINYIKTLGEKNGN